MWVGRRSDRGGQKGQKSVEVSVIVGIVVGSRDGICLIDGYFLDPLRWFAVLRMLV